MKIGAINHQYINYSTHSCRGRRRRRSILACAAVSLHRGRHPQPAHPPHCLRHFASDGAPEGQAAGGDRSVPIMAHFGSLTIHDHADGWGPPPNLPPAKFRDMPYAPFSKSDRLGRAADWSAAARYGAPPPGIDGADDEEGAFTTVDTRTIKPSGFGRGRGAFRGGRMFSAGIEWSVSWAAGGGLAVWSSRASGLKHDGVGTECGAMWGWTTGRVWSRAGTRILCRALCCTF